FYNRSIVVDGKHEGYVYMFLGTESIEKLVNGLTKQFIIAGAITFLLIAFMFSIYYNGAVHD
ncbi:hypothetical protein ACUODJ_48385, partial [Escherichia sp. HC-CC]